MSERSRKSGLEATQQAVKFFEPLMHASTDGILITDATQNIVIANEAFCSFFGRYGRDVIGTNLFLWLEQLDGEHHSVGPSWSGASSERGRARALSSK